MTVVLALHIHDLISRVHLYIIVLWHEDKFRVLLTEGIRIHFPLISLLFFDKLTFANIVLSDWKCLHVTFVYSVVESGSELLLPCFYLFIPLELTLVLPLVISEDIRNAAFKLILSTPRRHTAHANPHIEHVEIIIRILYGSDRKGDKRRDKRIRER